MVYIDRLLSHRIKKKMQVNVLPAEKNSLTLFALFKDSNIRNLNETFLIGYRSKD